jgi:hypothetical protein
MSIATPQPPKKSALDTVANIAIILVCAAAAVVLSFNIRDRLRQPGAPPQVEKGEQFAALKGAVPEGATRALVVAVSPTCHFCNDSLPFYKQLVDERNQKGSAVKFVAAVPTDDAKAPESDKFVNAGVKPDNVVHLDFSAIKVPGTPTLLLVDNTGKVLNVWVGKLDASGEKEVLKTL